MGKNVEYLGQVFTTANIVQQMLSLRKNRGSIMEPSCGAGAFFNELEKSATGIEFDSSVCPEGALNMDFFDFPVTHKFDTIIGNPPYVKFRNIYPETRKKLDLTLFDERTNLYLFFIEKCIRHLAPGGELIFIVPRDFIKASSAVKMNAFIYEEGSITDWIDLGDRIVFPGFSPNCVIFRFQKDLKDRKTIVNEQKENPYYFEHINGQLLFTQNHYPIAFSDLFFVKVGAVSGLDNVFTHENGNVEMVCSTTRDTGQTKRMFYNHMADELFPFKENLLSRKIRSFTEKNWYHWGRNYYVSDSARIYVNAKTRRANPFFIHEAKAFDGSILAVFPRFKTTPALLNLACEKLNEVNWHELGFICNGRYLFSQRALEQCMLPEDFSVFLTLQDKG